MTIPTNKTRIKILFVAPPKVHLLDMNGPAHIFYEAIEYGAPIDLHFITPIALTKITSSSGLKFYDLEPFESFELSKNDFVIIPGMDFSVLTDDDFLKDCALFFQWLNLQAAKGVNICSVCTGTFLLAEAGLLVNKSCTTHWRRIAAFKERFPTIDIQGDRLFVVNENIYTSAGITSGIDLALYILERHFSTKLAVDVAKEAVVYFRRGESDPQLSIFLQYRNHLNERIHQAQAFIIENVGSKFTHKDIAQQVNMSIRNLTRVFKKVTGVTIHDYTEKLRVEKAINLLAEKNKGEMVAAACGFKSVSQLLQVLNKYK